MTLDTIPAEETALDVAPVSGAPISIAQFKQRQELVKYGVSEMEDKVHYGLIPGTKGGKSLWEPGAEYLRYAFSIRWDYEVVQEHEDFEKHEYRYRIRAFAFTPDNTVGASWVASASSKEAKFNNMQKDDLQNNVFDRALKRAFVNLIRNVTGTSGYFKGALDTGPGEDGVESVEHDWFTHCPDPDHDEAEWFQTEKMRSPAHRYGNNKWCNQDRAIAKAAGLQVTEGAETLEWDKDRLTQWLKDEYKGTWANLKTNDHLSAMAAISALVTAELNKDEVVEEEPEPAQPEQPELPVEEEL